MTDDERYLSEFGRRRRRLPHWEEPGAAYFITFTLQRPPVVDLTLPEFGQLTVGALRYFDGTRYTLFDYTVMPDHVHAIIKPMVDAGKAERLSSIMYSVRRWVAIEVNRRLGRKGKVWQDEHYDHILRNERDYQEKSAYIPDNPRRKGLILRPEEWPWWGKGSGVMG